MQTESFGLELKKLGFSDFVGVPCSYLSPLINWAINENAFIMANNEGEAVAIASGISLCNLSFQSTQESHNRNILQNPHAITSRYGVVLMQNSGLSNALSPLTSFNFTFEIPILGFVSLRGEPNEKGENTDEPQHELLGQITHKILEICKIEYDFLESNLNLAINQLHKAKKALDSKKSFFFIVRKGIFSKIPLQNNPLANLYKANLPQATLNLPQGDIATKDTNTKITPLSQSASKPTRLQALQIIQNLATNALILATTGKCGRELYELGDRANQLYMVGSMGCVSSIALGIALKTHKKVIAIDGDSALLMRLGTLSGNAFYANNANKGNFCHILLDNESHDSTGGQFNLSPFVDFVALAKDCGYANAIKARNLDEFERALKDFLNADSSGAYFIALKIAKGSKEHLGRPKITPKEVALRFSAFLKS